MPTRDEILREKTFKGDLTETERRVFQTLTGHEGLVEYRTVKAVASLVKLLQDRNVLSEQDVDDILFECVH